MFSQNADFARIIKAQYLYKVKAYSLYFTVLFVIQIFSLLLSYSGHTSCTVFGSGESSITILTDTGLYILLNTLIWMFTVAFMLPYSRKRDLDFTFVSNRATSDCSNLLLMITFSAAGAVSASLFGILTRLLSYFLDSGSLVVNSGYLVSFGELLFSAAVLFFYLLAAACFGYFLRNLFRRRAAAAGVVLLAVGLIVLEAKIHVGLVVAVFSFFFRESSFPLFTLKILVFCACTFTMSCLLFLHAEVKKS